MSGWIDGSMGGCRVYVYMSQMSLFSHDGVHRNVAGHLKKMLFQDDRRQ